MYMALSSLFLLNTHLSIYFKITQNKPDLFLNKSNDGVMVIIGSRIHFLQSSNPEGDSLHFT